MASKRQLKNKIQAVSNIEQMTRAMQLVAATKMRKSQSRALLARPYAKKAMDLLRHIVEHSSRENLWSPFFEKKDARESKVSAKNICFVVVSSDRGLAGAFNNQVLRRATSFLKENRADIVAVGKKARDFFRKRNMSPVAEFLDFSDIITLGDSEPLSRWLIQKYLEGAYDKVFFCSTQFISALNTRAEIRQLLPLNREALQNIIDNIIPEKGRYSELRTKTAQEPQNISYIFEPSPQELFEELIDDLVRVAILHFMFESNASEHSSRMIAMKNATDNAENLLETLVLDLNKLRQNVITQELTEISTAKEALVNE